MCLRRPAPVRENGECRWQHSTRKKLEFMSFSLSVSGRVCGIGISIAYLSYTQHDARDLLLPFLLNRPEGLAVDMDVVLLADPKMLHAEPDGMTGRVAKYALRLSRPGA